MPSTRAIRPPRCWSSVISAGVSECAAFSLASRKDEGRSLPNKRSAFARARVGQRGALAPRSDWHQVSFKLSGEAQFVACGDRRRRSIRSAKSRPSCIFPLPKRVRGRALVDALLLAEETARRGYTETLFAAKPRQVSISGQPEGAVDIPGGC